MIKKLSQKPEMILPPKVSQETGNHDPSQFGEDPWRF